MPSPSWLTEPSIATRRAASAGRPAAKTPKGAARMARPSLQACRCWAEMGAARPRRRFSSVPRSLKPAPRNGPSSRSAIQWCQAASTWAAVSAEPCRASSRPEKIAYSVSSVPAGSSVTKPVDAAPACADLGRLHVLGGGAQRVTDREAQQRAARPFAETGGVPGGRDRGNAGNRCHDGPLHRGVPEGLSPLRICPTKWFGGASRASASPGRHLCAGHTDERRAVKPQVSTAFLAGGRGIRA